MQVHFTPIAEKSPAAISDTRIRLQIASTVERLAHSPELQGKPLSDELSGCRSVRAAGRRYRIIYQIRSNMVVIILVGIRKEGSKIDVYNVAKKLVRHGLL